MRLLILRSATGILAVTAGFILAVASATAESGQSPMVGPPVERSAHVFDLRQDANDKNPIAYSFRIAVEDTKSDAAKKPDDKDSDAFPLPAGTKQELSPAQQYCSSILDATSAAQIAQQTRNLQTAQKEINDRIALLTAKAEVLKSWMKLRADFASRARDSLVQIYSRMKPDSAAAQLAVMDEMTSAAILSKLSPKIASPIMAEMDVAKAARLSAVIADSGEVALKPERKADAQ
jgi:flagellar motility protein MotE (MotC chaperone)